MERIREYEEAYTTKGEFAITIAAPKAAAAPPKISFHPFMFTYVLIL